MCTVEFKRFGIALFVAAIFAGGCQQSIGYADIGDLYDRAAQAHDPSRNPVIVIPGILGTRLIDEASGQVVWGAFGKGAANPEKKDGARLVALPMATGAELDALVDATTTDGVLDRVHVKLLGLPIELKAYMDILGTLGAGGFRDELLGMTGAVDYGDAHFTCFQFGYDWRRDNVENARRLHEFIAEKRAYVQAEIENRYGVVDADVKFDIVAHSMGGLVTRYMLRYGDADLVDGAPPPLTWAGAEHVERVILVATPSAGSAIAVEQLVEGAVFGPFLPKYEPGVLGTMPAIYQLLPRPRHAVVVDATTGSSLDHLDPEVWSRYGWGLVDPDEADVLEKLLPEVPDAESRRAIAYDHLAKCLRRARGFFDAVDAPADLPEGVDLSLIAGDAVPTLSRLEVDERGRVVSRTKAPGDGTVVRSSALMDERIGGEWQRQLVTPIDWHHVTFLFTDHLGLTKDPVFTDNVLYQLLEEPR